MNDKLWDKGEPASSSNEVVEAFTVGDDYIVDMNLLADDCWASITHAAALTKAGVLSTEELGQIQRVLLDIIRSNESGQITIHRTQEDCHTAIEQILTEKLGSLGKKIHTGRSRNDQVLTALRLFTRRRLVDVGFSLFQLASRLLKHAERGARLPMRGYSHTRPAMPTTLAVWLGGYVELLLEDSRLLQSAYLSNDVCPLGTAAGFGSPIPLDREFTQHLLGFSRLQVNALACQTGRGVTEGTTVHALERIQNTLGSFASDLILFSTPEFGFLAVPNEFTTGSSIMPQKRNPDVLELVRARCGVVFGAASQIRMIGSRLVSGYHRDYQLLKAPLINTLNVVEESLQIMTKLVENLGFDEESMRASCSREIYAADIALEKSLEGVPFREAYRNAMAELDNLTINEEFIESRISAYQTLGAMGNPGLERYSTPLTEFEEWLLDRREKNEGVLERLRKPLQLD